MCNSLLASLCRLLPLTLACAVFTGSAADKESTDELTARSILDKTAITYATCKSYHDSGVVTKGFGPHLAGEHFARHIDVKPFRTAFVRSDRFRFEYDNPTPEKPYILSERHDRPLR